MKAGHVHIASTRGRRCRSSAGARPCQRGVALLAATVVLLVTMTLMVGYLHRTLLFGSRSAANQWRATRAFHAAEAGFDWALARLNDPTPVGDDCLPAPGGSSFRDRYLVPDASGSFSPAASASSPGLVSCVLGAGVLSCSCPAPGPAMPAPTGHGHANYNEDSRFTVGFAAMPGDPRAVTLTAQGCTDLTSTCASSDDQGLLQAFARVQAVVKLPAAASRPAAPMAVVPGTWHDE